MHDHVTLELIGFGERHQTQVTLERTLRIFRLVTLEMLAHLGRRLDSQIAQAASTIFMIETRVICVLYQIISCAVMIVVMMLVMLMIAAVVMVTVVLSLLLFVQI